MKNKVNVPIITKYNKDEETIDMNIIILKFYFLWPLVKILHNYNQLNFKP